MKLLLIEAVNPRHRQEIAFFSLGLGCIASYLKKHLPLIDIKIINKNIERTLGVFRPDLVGISSVSQNFNKAKEIAKLCKERGIFVGIGGCHISSLPASLSPFMDLGVIGEGEETMLEILKVAQEFGFDINKLRQLKGIVYRDHNGKIVTAPPRELISPLDKIPFADRDLLGIKNRNVMMTSRGCPYRCVFCSSSRMWPKVRWFSAEYVVGEIKEMFTKYDSRYIELWDDLVIANRERLIQIINLLDKEGLLGKIKFCFAVRANLIDEEMAHLLKELGVVLATMGLESMSPEVLKYLKGNVTVEQNCKAVKILNKFGIKVSGSFIIGSPMEKEQDVLKTLDFVENADLNGVSTYLLTPFPGTPVWQYARDKGLVSEDMDWERLRVDFGGNLDNRVVVSEVLSKENLCNLLKKFYRIKRRKGIAFRIRRLLRMIAKAFAEPDRIIPTLKIKIKIIVDELRIRKI